MKLILIHGRSQERLESLTLEADWRASLERGFAKTGRAWPTGVTTAFPYYADELIRLMNIVNSPLLTHILERGEAADPMDDFRASVLGEMAAGYGITNREIQAQYEGAALERAPQNWRWVLATARALDRTPLRSKMIDLVTRDVYVYLSSSGTRFAVDSIVAKLMPPDEPCVVVAHSLGSVVAYNVLNSLPKLDVRLFATLGSPLGIKAVKEKNGLPLRFPTCIERWFNARDPRDIVALRPLDDTYFWIRPTIENTSKVVNFTDNCHSIEGYLEDAAVATIVYTALTGS
jgi:hypothetical protein